MPARLLIVCLTVIALWALVPGNLEAETTEPTNPLYDTAHMFEYGTPLEPTNITCEALCHAYLGTDAPLAEAVAAWQLDTNLDTTGSAGIIGAMCASCHRSDGAYAIDMVDAWSDNNVYHPNSHGQMMLVSNPPTATDTQGSGLPHITGGSFECSTCHDPHSDDNRPFLSAPINTICVRCHQQRNFINGIDHSGVLASTGSWDLNNFGGLSNPGSHPVGEDVDGTRPGSPPVEINCWFKTEFAPDPRNWSLGPHLSNGVTGGVTCLTCHAVHGVALDTGAYGGTVISYPPNPLYLAVPQAEGVVSGYNRIVANGAGEFNRLCEGCHGVDNNPVEGPYGAWLDPDHSVNPGNTGSYGHPVDTYPSSTFTGVDEFPQGWPKGDPSLAGDKVSKTLICETCHSPHPSAAIVDGRSDVLPGSGAFILRAPLAIAHGEQLLCDQCHQQVIPGHHPINKSYDSSGVSSFQNTKNGPDDLLTCSTCHVNAHNWVKPGWAGLDPSWLPFDNGRGTDQIVDMYNPDMSKTCMDCHYFMDGDSASVSPTLGSSQTVINPDDTEYEHFQSVDKGNGTHYVGRIHEDDGELAWINNPIIDMFDPSRNWYDQAPDGDYAAGLAFGWSRFGGENTKTKRVLVCESCHELEPDKNRGFKHLLLAPYEEGRNGLDEYPESVDSDGRDILCEACHGNPEGSHPLTGDVVSRTDEPLSLHKDWVRQPLQGYATATEDWNGLVALSCDSCHQPHDANSNSRTYILDVPELLPDSILSGIAIEPGLIMIGYSEMVDGPTQYPEADGSPGTYTTPRDDMGTFTGNCIQCHDR